MSEEPTILVVGSVNMDLVVRAPVMPAPGETVLGSGFATAPGGKCANQAVAVARQGGRCIFLGCVGEDAFGASLLEGMRADGIGDRVTEITQGPNRLLARFHVTGVHRRENQHIGAVDLFGQER